MVAGLGEGLGALFQGFASIYAPRVLAAKERALREKERQDAAAARAAALAEQKRQFDQARLDRLAEIDERRAERDFEAGIQDAKDRLARQDRLDAISENKRQFDVSESRLSAAESRLAKSEEDRMSLARDAQLNAMIERDLDSAEKERDRRERLAEKDMDFGIAIARENLAERRAEKRAAMELAQRRWDTAIQALMQHDQSAAVMAQNTRNNALKGASDFFDNRLKYSGQSYSTSEMLKLADKMSNWTMATASPNARLKYVLGDLAKSSQALRILGDPDASDADKELAIKSLNQLPDIDELMKGPEKKEEKPPHGGGVGEDMVKTTPEPPIDAKLVDTLLRTDPAFAEAIKEEFGSAGSAGFADKLILGSSMVKKAHSTDAIVRLIKAQPGVTVREKVQSFLDSLPSYQRLKMGSTQTPR